MIAPSAQLEFIKQGAAVRRFHTINTINTDTVGSHSFGVAQIVALLMGEAVTAKMLLAALRHDLAEQQYGDVPSPAKKMLGIGEQFSEMEDGLMRSVGLSPLSVDLDEEEAKILKMADCLDGLMFCLHERRMGNRYMGACFRNYSAYISSAYPTGTGRALFSYITSEWRKINNVD